MLLILGSILLVWLLLLVTGILVAERTIVRLADLPRDDLKAPPMVSIIVAARNEAESIEQAVRSLLVQEYPAYELIVVNDRSTDQTSTILERIRADFPQLQIVNVTDLPPGWLGKCHALQCGANEAKGEWLLFTDADVSMRPDTLHRALSFAEHKGVDHLALVPECIMPTHLTRAFVATFAVFFKMLVRPAEIANPKSKAHAGIGAFNLVRRSAYEAIDGHCKLAMRPDDDLRLGREIKFAGFKQRLASGIGLISVPWYPTFWAIVRGLEKNSFAGIDYSLVRLVSANIMLFVTFIVPFLLLIFTQDAAWWVNLASIGVIFVMAIKNARELNYPMWYGLFFPVGTLLFMYIMNRATFLTLWRGGISWRDHFYPLSDLKRNAPAKPIR